MAAKNSTTPLSDNALRVLRQIHERGLTVLWSFRIPNPVYDDGERMSADDWRIADRELWRVVEKSAVMMDGERVRYQAWESDYIRTEEIRTDEWTEEYVGLKSRYLLTDKGLAVLKSAEIEL